MRQKVLKSLRTEARSTNIVEVHLSLSPSSKSMDDSWSYPSKICVDVRVCSILEDPNPYRCPTHMSKLQKLFWSLDRPKRQCLPRQPIASFLWALQAKVQRKVHIDQKSTYLRWWDDSWVSNHDTCSDIMQIWTSMVWNPSEFCSHREPSTTLLGQKPL